jgi:hypothetical protein
LQKGAWADKPPLALPGSDVRVFEKGGREATSWSTDYSANAVTGGRIRRQLAPPGLEKNSTLPVEQLRYNCWHLTRNSGSEDGECVDD